MERQWPEIYADDTLVVNYPKGIAKANSLVISLFLLVIAIFIIFSIRYALTNPVEIKLLAGMGILMSLGGILGVFLMKNVRNAFGKTRARLVANHEGLFLDILPNAQKAFFIPWNGIETFKNQKISDPFWGRGGWRTESDTLSIFFKPSANITPPKFIKNAAAFNQNCIHLHNSSLNVPIEYAIRRLNVMQNRLERIF